MKWPDSNDPDVVDALKRIEGELENLELLRGKKPDPIEPPAKAQALKDQQDMSQRLKGTDADYFKKAKVLKTDDAIRRTKTVDLSTLRSIVDGQIRNVDLP